VPISINNKEDGKINGHVVDASGNVELSMFPLLFAFSVRK
jgi:hypothetical protein